MSENSYVLVTAAYNEGEHIPETIRSVVQQTCTPARWIIVSDASTDRTDEIVKAAAKKHPYIELLRITEEHERNFKAQANAINAGIARLRQVSRQYIGNLDADVSLNPEYFETLLSRFRENARLGLAGGAIHDIDKNGQYHDRWDNSPRSVAHAVQMFRRECFDAIGGGYVPMPYGGPDTVAETQARMKGWEVKTFFDLVVRHNRPSNSAGGLLRSRFRAGKMDYSLGYLPRYELGKLLRRIRERPLMLSAIARMAGFLNCYLKREKRPVSQEFITFLRSEQGERIQARLQGKPASDPI